MELTDIRMQGLNHTCALIMDLRHSFRHSFHATAPIYVEKYFICFSQPYYFHFVKNWEKQFLLIQSAVKIRRFWLKRKKEMKTTKTKFIANIHNYNANICISKFSIYRLKIFSNICLKLAIITCILPLNSLYRIFTKLQHKRSKKATEKN